ncbi:MAG: sigma-70 family RNA polymerase sigma factor [Myxococcales bacterium]|nr:sigma-70 family RNA polymerase sigma factor [Myxococcales bacterium]
MREDNRVEVADELLLRSIAGGDRDALAELYDRHVGVMMAVAMRILRDRTDAEDLLHDVFIEAWQKAADFDGARGSVRSWLLMRVRSRAIDRTRSLAVARQHAVIAKASVTAFHPEWETADHERAERALRNLPDEQRVLVELSYFEGLTYREMAERAGIPIGTVRSRLSAAMQKLRRDLPAEPGVEAGP